MWLFMVIRVYHVGIHGDMHVNVIIDSASIIHSDSMVSMIIYDYGFHDHL